MQEEELNLNTSHVKVNHSLGVVSKNCSFDLNTSHVKVNHMYTPKKWC